MSKSVITFGRFQPPTVGHQKLIDKVKSEAKKRGAMPHVYLSHSQDAKKNPLDYDTKVRIAKKAFGPSITKSKARNIIEVLKELEKMGHTEVTIVVGSDRVKEFDTLTSKYNGKEYNFDKIDVVSAGDRDPDAEGVSGMSASKMRAAAQAGDYDLFKKGTPTAMSEKDKKFMYDKIRSEMGISEEKELEVTDDDFEFTDAELERFIDAIDIESLDEEGELDEEFEEFLEEVLLERKPLTVQQRLAIGRRMKRLQPRIKRRREMLKKRMATPAKLETRARKAAIKLLRKRFAGKQGQNYASLSPSSKISVDRIIQKKMAMVGKISKRLLPKIRKAEQERLKRARSAKNESVDINATFESYLNEAVSESQYIFEEEDDQTNVKLMNILRQAFRDPTERQLVIRSLKGGEKTLSNPKLRPFILKLLNRLLDAAQQDPAIYNKMRDKLRRMGQDDEVKEAQDPDIKDRPGSQPAGYHKGLKKSTKVARDRHFKKYANKSDSDPSNYKPAPGDKGAKTKPSVHTQKYKAMYGEDIDAAFEKFISEEYIEEKALEGLKKKAEKSGIPYSTLKKVYDRGMAAWKSGHRPGTTPQQWAYARVNSFITGGKTRQTADADLWKGRKEEVDIDEAYRVHAVSKTKEYKVGDSVTVRNIKSKRNKTYTIAKVRNDGKFETTTGKIIYPSDISEQDAVKATKERIKREKEADKRKHDAMLDRARTQDTQAKNRAEEVEIDEYNTKTSKAIVYVNDKPTHIYPDLKSAQKDHYGKPGVAIGMVSKSKADRIRKANPKIKIHEEVVYTLIGEEANVYTKTATKAKNKEGTVYAFGREKSLDGQPKEKGGYIVWKLASNYDGKVRGGIRKSWVYIEKNLSYADAVKLMNRRLKYKAFNESFEVVHDKCGTPECCGMCDTAINESFTAGISDTMFATEFEEHKVHGGFALHPSVMEQGGAGEEGTSKLVKKYKKETPGEISEAIEFMKRHDIDLVENIYRPLSEKYFEFFREARRMMQEGEMEFSGLDKQILETDLGEFDWYEDMEVPLDCPMVAIDDTIDEKMYYAIATKSAKSKSGWRRVPDTRFDTKQSAERYGDKYHTDKYGSKMYKVVTFSEEAEPELNKPKRGGPKKFYVYVRDPSSGNVKKVTFGDTSGLKAKINNPAARKSFAARHQCDTRNDKTTASYWACRLPRYAASLGMQVDNPGAFW